MEYPTLVTTAGDSVFTRPGMRLPEYVTVHEVGHNWFQGMLASNEPSEAWLDEGVNEWADAKRDGRALRPAHAARIDWMGWQAEVGALRRAVAGDPGVAAVADRDRGVRVRRQPRPTASRPTRRRCARSRTLEQHRRQRRSSPPR